MELQELKDVLKFDLSSAMMDSFKQTPMPQKKELVDMLYNLSWTDEHPYAWRSAWVLEHIVVDDKSFIEPYLQEIIERLYDAKTDAQKRHFLKMLLLFPVDYVDMGRLLDLSFRWLESPTDSIAVRGRCITAVEEILKFEPEIKGEFIAILSILTNDESKGLKNKARKVLQKIQ